jgi:hypothetical protein
MLRFFDWVGRAKPLFLVLTIVAAVNICLYFFVHQAYLEAPPGDPSLARTTAAGESIGGELRTAPKSDVVSPEGAPSEAKAGSAAKAEGRGEGSGDGTGGDEKPAAGKASRSTSATSLYTATPTPPAASAAQYATAGATAEASPGGGFLPPGIGPLRRIPKKK